MGLICESVAFLYPASTKGGGCYNLFGTVFVLTLTMKRFIPFFFTFLCLYFNAIGQMSADKTMFDYGVINNYNNDTAYFYFTNNGAKTVYLLTTQPREDYQVFCNTKTIAPGEVLTIGIIYYTEKKGRFNVEVPLSFSNSPEPVKIKLTGTIKSIHPNALTICPSIENSRPLNHTVPLNIIVKDRETNLKIKDPRVSVLQQKRTINCVPGFQSMAYQCNCNYGRILVNASKEGYEPASMQFDFDAVENTCIIYLEKKPVEKQDTVIREIKQRTIVQKDTITEDVIVYKPAGDNTGFNSTQYKPNHLIFVIDVSGSMKDSTKLAYLKESMKALINVLRPQDYITLITYANKSHVVFENVSGASKAALIYAVDTLHARGASVGSEALKMAYDMAHKHFIQGGNNQIFLATDGMFNGSSLTENDLYKIARHEANKNDIKLSTVAFGKYKKSLEFLRELADKGKGKMLTIGNINADKEVLIEEVKACSITQ